jgi:hypothetical protein
MGKNREEPSREEAREAVDKINEALGTDYEVLDTSEEDG